MGLTDLLAPLEQAAFHLWGVPVTWTELLGDATGLACVAMVARQSLWNWPLGLLNNALFFLLFFRSKLYGDAFLQIIFALLSLYGWWSWARREEGTVLAVRRTGRSEALWLVGLTLFGTWGATRWLDHQTDSPVPLWDATVLVWSLVATYGQARKLLECWWVWIAVDLISIPLYVSRKLYPTAALYGIFTFICIMGLRAWTRERSTALLQAPQAALT